MWVPNRCGIQQQQAKLTNLPDTTTDIAIWSTVENGVGITAGCVATLRPLVSKALHRFGVRSTLDPSKATDIPKDMPRGHRMSLHAMSFGNRAVNGHGTVTTITGQRGNDGSRGSSEEPLAPTYPGKIGKTFYVETETSRVTDEEGAKEFRGPYSGLR